MRMRRMITAVILLLTMICRAALADILVLPEGLTIIGEETFMGDTSLEEVIVPSRVTKIGSRAFARSSATNIYLPEDINEIGTEAFPSSAKLYADAGSETDATLKNSGYVNQQKVTNIDDFEFEAADSYPDCRITAYKGDEKEIVLPSYDKEGRKVIEITCFEGSEGLETIVMPEGAIFIRANAFKGNTTLKRVIMSESISQIGDEAFWGCTALEEISLENVMTYGHQVFQGCTSLEQVDLGEHLVLLSDHLFDSCISLEYIRIPASVREIEVCCFSECKNLKTVIFADGSALKKLGYGAFEGCLSLSNINLPATLTALGSNLFRRCESLEQIIIPYGVQKIGSYCFAESGLTSISIPESVLSIDWCAFEDCKQLKQVTIFGNMQKIRYGAFRDCVNLKTFQTLESETETACIMENYMFVKCEKLTSVTLPSCTTQLGSEFFKDCKRLESVALPYGVESIGYGFLTGCESILSVYIPETVTSIPADGSKAEFLGLGVFGERATIENVIFRTEQQSYFEDFANSKNSTLSQWEDAFRVNISNTVFPSHELARDYLSIDPIADVVEWVGMEYTPAITFTDRVERYYLLASDNEVVSVIIKDGRPTLKINQLGMANITVLHGIEEVGSFTVYAALELDYQGDDLSNSSLALPIGTSKKLDVRCLYNSAVYDIHPEEAVWHSLDPGKCSVDQNGTIQALRMGNARIAITIPYTMRNTLSGSLEQRTTSMGCYIKIGDPVPFTLSAKSWNLGINESVNVIPSKNGHFTYTVDNTAVARTVSSKSGRLIGVGAGTTKITVIADDGEMATATVYVHGNGFSYKDYLELQDLTAARKKGSAVVSKVINEMKTAQKATIKRINDKIDMYIGVPSTMPQKAQEAFLEEFHRFVSSFKTTFPMDYTEAKTEAQLIKMIVSRLEDSNHTFKFAIIDPNNEDVVIQYTCHIEKIGVWGNNLEFGYIESDRGMRYEFMATQVNETNIEKEMSYLQALTEVKIADVKEAAFSDAGSLLRIDEAKKWLTDLVEQQSFDAIKELYPLQERYISAVQQAVKDLKNIKDGVSALKIDLQGKNSAALIENVSSYHSKLEAWDETVDELLK